MMILNKLKLGKKLPLVVSLLIALAVGTVSLVSMNATKSLIGQGAVEKLQSIAQIQASRVQVLLEAIERDLVLQAGAPYTSGALKDLAQAYGAMKNASDDLRRVFITENEHPLGQKDLLVKANTGSSYGFRHAAVHPHFDSLQNDMDYYDVFLLDTDGNLVYSVFKEDDFATNMLTGPWKASGLAEAFRQAIELGPDDAPVFTDFAPYEPSAGAPAAFVAKPVFDTESSKLLGVMAYQMPIDALNSTVSDIESMGPTSNGFIVGDDRLMRTDSIMTEANDILSVRVDTLAVTEGLAGNSGFHKELGPTGSTVFAAYVPFAFRGLNWVVFVEQDETVIFSGLASARFSNLVAGLTVFGFAFLASLFFSRGITRPVQSLTEAVTEVADGKLHTEVPGISRHDEVGDLARATETFRQNALRMEELTAEQAATSEKMSELTAEREKTAARERQALAEKVDADQLAAQEREEMMQNLGDSIGDVVRSALSGEFSARVNLEFDDQVLIDLAKDLNLLMAAVDHGLSETSSVLESVASGDLSKSMDGDFQGEFGRLQTNVNKMISALTQLVGNISSSGEIVRNSSGELRHTAEDLSRQAEQNASAAAETSTALVQLSTSMKQVSTNLAGVGENAQHTRSQAESSGEISSEAAKSMDRIAEGSQKISQVIDVINDIAFQINLLALNAGVEAARAGEAGLGFSVVASEVRQLSHRASDAAKEIAEVIVESDQAVEAGVTHVSNARKSLEEISESVVSISENIDALASAVNEQSGGIDEITQALSRIDQNTQTQAASFEEVTASSQLLANEASELTGATSQFRLANSAVSKEGQHRSAA